MPRKKRDAEALFREEKSDAVVKYYDRSAGRLAETYDGLKFEVVHRDLPEFLPERPGRALDVGAGSGRDAAALAARGYAVCAIEPSAALRRQSEAHYRGNNLTWIDDRLPSLSSLRGVQSFELILCSAVWMHLTADEQRASMVRFSELAAPDAILCITFRQARPGETVAIYSIKGEDVVADARVCGFRLLSESRSPDWVGRTGVEWRSLIFQKAG